MVTTGSEANEAAIKLAKTYGLRTHGPAKRVVVSFRNAFHGRTMGAQLAGGMAAHHEWLAGEGATFVRVPFPDGFKNPDTSFDSFPGRACRGRRGTRRDSRHYHRVLSGGRAGFPAG